VKKIAAKLILVLLVAEMLLTLLSWILSVVATEAVHTLLSDEGIRWLFGGFVERTCSPLLLWLMLLSMAYGVLSASGSLIRSPQQSSLSVEEYRHRLARRLSIAAVLLFVTLIAVLSFVPHAILLSATGSVYSSPFSRAAVPLLVLALTLYGFVYGFTARTFTTWTDFCSALFDGLAKGAPLILCYIVLKQFVDSLLFVFA